MNTKILIGTIITIIITAAGVFILWYIPAHQCPASCDDKAACTQDFCSKETGYKCSHSAVLNCCPNEICEMEEKYETCAADCPNCDDNNECTKDSYDYHQQKCVNAPLLDKICCGNGVCETQETYANCSRDCPDCDDDNDCTKDSYDYHQRKCLNEIIVPCCGNGVCDKDAEASKNCSKDCPDCDDGNKLTSDSFNYATQKCENPVTHYFIDDFETGLGGWSFYNAVDGRPDPGPWTLIREGGNTVLRGVNHNFADIARDGWDNYILKFKFKRIKGAINVNFRNNFFTPEQPTHRYMIRLDESNQLALAKGFNESKGIYKNLQQTPAAYLSGWHTLEVRNYQDIINIYLDGKLLIKHKDSQEPILSGKVNFETLDDSEFLFDNVEIKLISQKDIVYP
jgi:hypothetical protein